MNSIEQRIERLRKRKAVEDAPKLAAEARRVKAMALQHHKEHARKQRRKAEWGVFWRKCRRKGWPVPVSNHREEQEWSKELLDAETLKAEAKAASYTRGPYNKRPAWTINSRLQADPIYREQELARWREDTARQEVEEAAADVKFQQDLRALKERQEREAQRYNVA